MSLYFMNWDLLMDVNGDVFLSLYLYFMNWCVPYLVGTHHVLLVYIADGAKT